DGFTTMRTVVDGDAEAGVRDAFTAGDLSGGEEQMAERGGILRTGLRDPWDRPARDDEDVDGGLRGNIAEGDADIILMDDVRGDLLVAYFLEQRLVSHAEGRFSRPRQGGKTEGGASQGHFILDCQDVCRL